MDYKAQLKAQQDALKEQIAEAVAADEFPQTRAGGLQVKWLQNEVSRLIDDILSEKLSYDDYVMKRAKVVAHREFLDFLARKPSSKATLETKLETVNGQLSDITTAEQQSKSGK